MTEMKTYSTKASDIKREWHVIDASGRTLGRLASEVAQLLRGKHKPMYVPHLDTGDYVIVINADKVRVTGNKAKQKLYYRHSGYRGGLKSTSLAEMMESHPTRVIEHAVRGMLPKGPLGRAMLKKLKVYAGPKHPHQAQVKEG
jgi:large subunit ribosomal protein L13